ncbi:STAS domain-containing protein [Streptosporangium sp. KLBMP 9127]|nr:STAS domain-containing protein [Streptosporangium sp. KLBMP 9127]
MILSVRSTTVGQDTAVVEIDGELDLSSAGLADAVLRPLPSQGIRHVIVAAARLRFCDVCGFRVLNNVHTTLTGLGGALSIAEPLPALQRLTHLMQSGARGTSIQMYATLDEALLAEIGGPVSFPIISLPRPIAAGWPDGSADDGCGHGLGHRPDSGSHTRSA